MTARNQLSQPSRNYKKLFFQMENFLSFYLKTVHFVEKEAQKRFFEYFFFSFEVFLGFFE